MAFFQFGRKLEIAKEYSFEEIPVFASLSPSEQRLVQKKARLVEYKKGDIIYYEGTSSESFYVVISGRYRLFRKPRLNQKEETLHYFYRGDHFGETSLLMNRPHSASVEAKRDGLILQLPKDDFLRMIKEIPSISLHLNRSLGHRLTRNVDDAGRHEVKIVALYATQNKKEVLNFWWDFAESLAGETKEKIVWVDLEEDREGFVGEMLGGGSRKFSLRNMDPSREQDLKRSIVMHPQGFDYLQIVGDEASDVFEKKLSTLMTFLTYRYHYVLLRLPGEISAASFTLLKKCDFVYVHTYHNASSITLCSSAVTEFQQRYGFGKSEIRLIVQDQEDGLRAPLDEEGQMLGLSIFSLLSSKVERPERYQATVRYLAKELAGTLLGLVLGSGAAYGLAHIGVFKALEEEKIYPDVIAGTSIGALIGALWAGGFDAHQLESIAKQLDRGSAFFKLIGFGDLAFFHEGFLKGNRIKKFLESYLGNQTFQDLRVPLKVVTADLFTSEEVVLETGSVVEAVRASISIPGIFKPVTHQGRYLIDGGVVDPLPVRVLAGLGVKKIIAVNVLSGPQDRIQKTQVQKISEQRRLSEIQQHQSPLKRFWAKNLHQVSSRYAVNIFNVIMSTVQFMEFEIANTWGEQADILIHPTVPEGHWAEFYAPDKYMKVGEEKTREKLPEIRRLIAER